MLGPVRGTNSLTQGAPVFLSSGSSRFRTRAQNSSLRVSVEAGPGDRTIRELQAVTVNFKPGCHFFISCGKP